MSRTSICYPLQIASLRPGPALGRIGITFCPGKYDPSAHTGGWERDLSIDLDAVRTWGAVALVTLLEHSEMNLLRVQNLGDEVSRRGLSWFHLPIVDVSIPDRAFEAAWERAGQQLRGISRSGADIIVHCRGGLGRAGMIAARLLIELGMMPERAVAEVRRVRPGAIETIAQERFVLGQDRIFDKRQS